MSHTVHGSNLLDRGTHVFPYTDPKKPQPSPVSAIAAILEARTLKRLLTGPGMAAQLSSRQEFSLMLPQLLKSTDVVCEEPSPAGVHQVFSGNIYQIRPSAKTFHYLVSRSQLGLAGIKAA